MLNTLKRVWAEESGAIISAELVLVMTICVLAMVVGLDSVSNAVNFELEDVAEAFGAISQSFSYVGLSSCKAIVSGSSFDDDRDSDACDCIPLDLVDDHPIRVPDKCE